jgi:CBS domain-containing membrane protein
MHLEGFRHVPVVDEDGVLVGLVTHRDLLRHVIADKADVPLSARRDRLERYLVGDYMIEEVATTEPDVPIAEAAQLMSEEKYGCLPVVEGMKLVGILTESDFVRYMAAQE